MSWWQVRLDLAKSDCIEIPFMSNFANKFHIHPNDLVGKSTVPQKLSHQIRGPLSRPTISLTFQNLIEPDLSHKFFNFHYFNLLITHCTHKSN